MHKITKNIKYKIKFLIVVLTYNSPVSDGWRFLYLTDQTTIVLNLELLIFKLILIKNLLTF